MLKQVIKDFISSSRMNSFLESTHGKYLIRLCPPRFQSFILSDRIHPIELPVFVAGFDFSICTSYQDDHFQSAFLHAMRKWEERPLAAWKNVVEKNSTVIDVGAYLGIYSIVALRQGARNVFAYEPNPVTATRLRENLKLNSLENSVIIRQLALSSTDGHSELLIPSGREYSSGAQLSESNIGRDLSKWESIEKVRTLTLDVDIRGANITKISAIKIDTEGFELQVLMGATDTLLKHKPVLLIEILEPQNLVKVSKFLRDFGYINTIALDGLDARARVRLAMGFPKANNYLFVHP